MTMLEISRDEARLLSVIAQKLDRRPRAKAKKQDVLEMIRHLGCVQLDTISVVARSHETVLWSRLGAFNPKWVWELYSPDRAVFEYWAHAAAIVPMESFPYFRRLMADRAAADHYYGEWLIEYAETAEHVLATVAEQGPVTSRSFDRPEGPRPEAWAWYGGKPTKQALDHLWTTGKLSIYTRSGFERYFDLTERIVPPHLLCTECSLEDQNRFFATTALHALGVATPRWTADYFRTSRPHLKAADAIKEFNAMSEGGLAVPVNVESFKEQAWLDPALVPVLEELRAGRAKPTLTTLLSPFDSLVWHRERALTLFDYDYRAEFYTPEPKRKYGYYSLTILHRGKIVGRTDLHYRRKEKLMTVKSLHLEPGVRGSEALAASIAGAIHDYLAFLGGGEIVTMTCNPDAFGPMLQKALQARA